MFLKWLRAGLDQAGRQTQRILALADGGFDVLDLWRSLPERVVLVTRTARNRALYWLPQAEDHPGPGRPASYGEPAPQPAEWLHKGLRNWPQQIGRVRGQDITMPYQVLGPFVRDGLPEQPLFLMVVKGLHRLVGKSKTHSKHKDPSFYLVSAVQREGQWVLPFAIPLLLAWLWQRWEIEGAHREMKSGLGVGEKQSWNPRSAIVAVQWSVWVYAVLLLAGYRTWGLLGGPATPARGWPAAKRWSLSSLWRAYRAALWEKSEFQALWTTTGDNWEKRNLVGRFGECLLWLSPNLRRKMPFLDISRLNLLSRLSLKEPKFRVVSFLVSQKRASYPVVLIHLLGIFYVPRRGHPPSPLKLRGCFATLSAKATRVLRDPLR